jgi:gamma-glutamyltranspeptidase/glutathione hydrolase
MIFGTLTPAGLAHAARAMVVSASPDASRIGVEIMRKGGNAFDAAAAVGFALAVTWPEAGNLGGGGLVVAVKAGGDVVTLDFREKAPAAAHRDMFLGAQGEVIKDLSLRSALASGVPGSVDGLLTLWRDHGTGEITLEELLGPAVRLAREGFELSDEVAKSFNDRANRFSADPGAATIFVRDDARPWAAGDTLRQADLSRTLERISRDGREGFYRGKTAELIVQQQARTSGLITQQDLDAYRSVYRPPVTGEFRGYTIVSMGPPSSGGIMLIHMLNMLDRYPIESMERGSAGYVHLLTEVQRRAYADRAEFLGDSDFFDVPAAQLLSREYAADRAADIQSDRATPSRDVTAGKPREESTETTHYSVVDPQGNAIAVTVTLNASFGSGIVIDGAGFFMNNEMDDFSVKPGVPNLYGVTGGEANAIAPNKRMLSSMTPTVVMRDGKPHMILGSPGGSTIITTVLQVFLNVAVHGMDIQAAVDARRHHSQWLPDTIAYEEGALDAQTRTALESMGHVFADKPRTLGAANCILIDADGAHGAPDRRRQHGAAGF